MKRFSLIVILFLSFMFSIPVVSATPANDAFEDDLFYELVVNEYNYQNNTDLSYDTNLSDEQLKTIIKIEGKNLYDGGSNYGKKLSNVKGIEKLTNLVSLDLNFNEISSIDLSKNVLLKEINLNQNNLTTIDLSKNIKIETLILGFNKLSTIDLSKNTQLKTIQIMNNDLSEIDLSNNILLTKINLPNNHLTTIDLSKNINLETLDLQQNDLTTIDLSKNSSLKYLDLENSNIEHIDLSNNKLLESLYIELINLTTIDLSKNENLSKLVLNKNNLSSIDLSKNINLKYLTIKNNNLTHIDLSNLKKLMYLDIDNNPLSIIDVTKNNKLKLLYLPNSINNLNLCNNPDLQLLNFYGNNLFINKNASFYYKYLDNDYSIENDSIIKLSNPTSSFLEILYEDSTSKYSLKNYKKLESVQNGVTKLKLKDTTINVYVGDYNFEQSNSITNEMTNPSSVKNPKTSDLNVFIAISAIVLFAGVIIVSSKRLKKIK